MNTPEAISIHYYVRWNQNNLVLWLERGATTNMLNKELEFTLNLAFKEAREKRHEFMTVEHLLLSLLDNPAAGNVLQACDANIESLRHDLIEFIDQTTPRIPEDESDRETQPHWVFNVYCNALFFMCNQREKQKSLVQMYWLLFLVNKKVKPFIFYVQENISRLDVINYISHGISKYHNNDMHDHYDIHLWMRK